MRIHFVGKVVTLRKTEELPFHFLVHVNRGQILMLVISQPTVMLNDLSLIEAGNILSHGLVGKFGLATDDGNVRERRGLFGCWSFILIYHQILILTVIV